MATVVDLNIEQGATYRHVFVYKDADTDAVIPLVGYSGRFQFRSKHTSADVLYDGDTTGTELTIDGPNGKVTLNIPDEDSEAFEFTKAVYDIEVESASGDVIRLVEGLVHISPEVTRT